MKIALFGASGVVGSRIAAEAVRRGHDVTAITRTGTTSMPGVAARAGDLGDEATIKEAAATHDVVVSATGPSRTGESHEPWLAAVQTLIDHGTEARVLFVGGAGSLVDPNGTRLLDTEGFPEVYRAEALSGAAALDLFRAAPADLDWTFFSPAPVIAPGERTGQYALGLDSPAGDQISAEDYAVAMLDEIEQPRHRRQRFTAAS
ncbi:NAD(P)-dependent oxidoreductase [Nostocoides sp. HKS02]|uniref:NAD(P)-dependent oxidoreductase n=1 Tax=Nostocoides sp. HKS02 TaxID=1813880 RepID=UPI0012B4611E|nr:NAD(P)H-binding protein [Tetrasphaera sp. HKS02]QGN56805.1 NAD(P)H-binding protein [Tetrasphaera sp. HKS02]